MWDPLEVKKVEVTKPGRLEMTHGE
jgi:hypothetical protein